MSLQTVAELNTAGKIEHKREERGVLSMESLKPPSSIPQPAAAPMLSAIKTIYRAGGHPHPDPRPRSASLPPPGCFNLIITAPEEDLEYTKALIEEYYGQEEKPWIVIPGGSQRQDSIFGALQLCPDDTSLVFIHDAVRPFISLELIAELGQQAVSQKAVIPVAKIKHTVKSIQGDHIENTIPRERLVHVFTPQVFDFELITNAYEKAYEDGFEGTDDASLVEHLGHPVGYLYGSDLNIKITDEDDLFLASQIIKHSMI